LKLDEAIFGTPTRWNLWNSCTSRSAIYDIEHDACDTMPATGDEVIEWMAGPKADMPSWRCDVGSRGQSGKIFALPASPQSSSGADGGPGPVAACRISGHRLAERAPVLDGHMLPAGADPPIC
jgi:hypothetical protein